jgi:hypothetical protein
MPLSEAAYWVAAVSGEGAQRRLAKQALYAWCVQAHRPAAELFGLSAPAIAEQMAVTPEQAEAILSLGGLATQAERSLDELRAWGVTIVTRADVAYPEELLAHLPEAWLPYALAYKGDLSILTEPGVALVGAAKPGPEAERMVRETVRSLVLQGRHLVGGYDRGVDRLALDAASAVGGQSTLVLPLGMRYCRAVLAADERAFAEGRRLALSPYPFDAPLSEAQARGRRALAMALCDTMLLIAPDQGPEAWPLVADLMRAGLQVRLWQPGESEPGRAWLALDALPFDGREAAPVAPGPSRSLGLSEQAPAPDEADPEAPLVAFGNAQEAIEALGRAGRVPEKLIRRLRESLGSDGPDAARPAGARET